MLFKQKIISTPGKYVFTIDGNYFFSRTFLAMGLTFKEKPKEDADALSKSLCTSFSSLVRTYAKSLDNVIFVRDRKSWRKSFEAALPAEKSHLVLDGYKANRVQNDLINWELAYATYDAFIDCLNKEMNVMCLDAVGAEGDDWLYFLKDQIVNVNGGKMLIFSSDGDIQQLVDNNTFIVKPMPQRRPTKLVANKYILENYFDEPETEQDLMSVFGTSTKLQDDVINMFDRSDIMIANPVQLLLTKVIYGDAKDNVHELFHWLKTAGNGQIQLYKPAATIIKAALKECGVDDILTVTVEQVYDKKFRNAMIPALLKASGLIPSTAMAIRNTPLIEFEIKSLNNEHSTTTELLSDIQSKLPITFGRALTALKKQELIANNKLADIAKRLSTAYTDKLQERRRCVVLTKNIWVQNLKLLHLDKLSIPSEVMDAMQTTYDNALSQGKLADIAVLSKFANILAKMKTTDSMFDGLENTIAKEETQAEIQANPTEVNTILKDLDFLN